MPKPLTYCCKWCNKDTRISSSTKANLKVHRDGSTQDGKNNRGCPNRKAAISAGAKLPPTEFQKKAATTSNPANSNNKLGSYFQSAHKFDLVVFNQILTLWLVRQALPWSRIEDPYLKLAFTYANPSAIPYKRKWMAKEAKQLYVVLQEQMLLRLKVSDESWLF